VGEPSHRRIGEVKVRGETVELTYNGEVVKVEVSKQIVPVGE
jgi:hypothetical protein